MPPAPINRQARHPPQQDLALTPSSPLIRKRQVGTCGPSGEGSQAMLELAPWKPVPTVAEKNSVVRLAHEVTPRASGGTKR